MNDGGHKPGEIKLELHPQGPTSFHQKMKSGVVKQSQYSFHVLIQIEWLMIGKNPLSSERLYYRREGSATDMAITSATRKAIMSGGPLLVCLGV